MYKEKLNEQLEKMEQLQEKCGICDISEFLTLAREIISISKKIDELNT